MNKPFLIPSFGPGKYITKIIDNVKYQLSIIFDHLVRKQIIIVNSLLFIFPKTFLIPGSGPDVYANNFKFGVARPSRQWHKIFLPNFIYQSNGLGYGFA